MPQRKKIGFVCMVVIAIILRSTLGFAEEPHEKHVTLPELQMSLELPEGWTPQSIPPDAATDGIGYAAQSPEKGMMLLIQQKPLRRSEGLETRAVWSARGEHVSVGDRIVVDGTEFLTSEETLRDGETTLTYRLASAVHAGKWLHLIVLDYTGQGAQMARTIMESFQTLATQEEVIVPVQTP